MSSRDVRLLFVLTIADRTSSSSSSAFSSTRHYVKRVANSKWQPRSSRSRRDRRGPSRTLARRGIHDDVLDANAQPDEESGWVSNFGKYLLPPSWSLSLSKHTPPPSATPPLDDRVSVDVSSYDPKARETADPIFLEGSTFATASGDAAEEECSVIDVECSVEEEEDENDNMASSNESMSGSVATERPKGGASNLLQSGIRRLRDRWGRRNGEKKKENRVWDDRRSEVQLVSLQETTHGPSTQETEFDSSSSANVTASVPDPSEGTTSWEKEQSLPTQSAAHAIPQRPKRSRRAHPTTNAAAPPPPIFHSLETNDIDAATQFKHKKWQRRRKRAAIVLAAFKNAAFLFVVTFLAGNVMNQFVDLTEDGSFEVHFGKSLSSPSSSSISRQSTRGGVTSVHHRPSSLGAETLGSVSRAVRRVGPAVVRVETETDVRVDADGGDEEDGRGDVFDGVPEAPPQSTDESRTIDFGQGSGMILRRGEEFHVLTNAHVVDGATRVYVLLTDGRRFKAELCGKDDIVDVAVLKILPEEEEEEGCDLVLDLPVAELGDSDRLEVGQFVTAIGSPGGLDNSCTIGIVSGLKRCPKVVGIPDKAGVLQYIQTDAAINQGNSGGPLVDVESGDIVAINTCIRANMEGTSFAIPINKVLGMLDDLYEGKHITHGYLGVQMSTVNPTLARYYNKFQDRKEMKIPEKDGVIVEKVFKKSPAEVGGLKKYDFVCEIDGQRVSNAEDAHLIIDQAPIGKDLCITLLRGDGEVTVQVKPEDLSVRLKQLREERLKRKKVNTSQ